MPAPRIHARQSVYRRYGQRTGEEAHFPSPFTSSRVVRVLVGYSPEFGVTVKRKQWPRQNSGTNAGKTNDRNPGHGMRSMGIQIEENRLL